MTVVAKLTSRHLQLLAFWKAPPSKSNLIRPKRKEFPGEAYRQTHYMQYASHTVTYDRLFPLPPNKMFLVNRRDGFGKTVHVECYVWLRGCHIYWYRI